MEIRAVDLAIGDVILDGPPALCAAGAYQLRSPIVVDVTYGETHVGVRVVGAPVTIEAGRIDGALDDGAVALAWSPDDKLTIDRRAA